VQQQQQALATLRLAEAAVQAATAVAATTPPTAETVQQQQQALATLRLALAAAAQAQEVTVAT
jgi:hypothetical protein